MSIKYIEQTPLPTGERIIQFFDGNTNGPIIEGQTRTRVNDDGEAETYEPYAELLDSGAEIQWRTDEEVAAEQAEAERVEKKRSDAKLKLEGVEFAGVMCSATKDDQFGLGSILPLVQQGYEFNFHFENGNKLKINPDNVVEFMTVWVPFREGFF